MRTFIALFLVFFLPYSATCSDKIIEYSTNPAMLNSQVKARGAKTIVNELYKSEVSWTQLMKQISSGEKPWLKVAVALRPGSDAGATSMLEEAVGLALLRKPANVLLIAIPTYEVQIVCGGRVDPLPTYELSMSELEKQIKSVQGVKEPQLQILRDSCLSELETSKVHLRRFFGRK